MRGPEHRPLFPGRRGSLMPSWSRVLTAWRAVCALAESGAAHSSPGSFLDLRTPMPRCLGCSKRAPPICCSIPSILLRLGDRGGLVDVDGRHTLPRSTRPDDFDFIGPHGLAEADSDGKFGLR